MRFFLPGSLGCTVTPGSQTRTRYDVRTPCIEDGERTAIHWVLTARDRMQFDVAASYQLE